MPTYRCTVVQKDLIRRQSPLPDDELIEGPCDVVIVGPVISSPNHKAEVGVAVVFRDTAGLVTNSEGPIDVDLQTIRFLPCEENVGPVRPWKGEQGHNEVSSLL